jgi:hypothetical protein
LEIRTSSSNSLLGFEIFSSQEDQSTRPNHKPGSPLNKFMEKARADFDQVDGSPRLNDIMDSDEEEEIQRRDSARTVSYISDHET